MVQYGYLKNRTRRKGTENGAETDPREIPHSEREYVEGDRCRVDADRPYRLFAAFPAEDPSVPGIREIGNAVCGRKADRAHGVSALLLSAGRGLCAYAQPEKVCDRACRIRPAFRDPARSADVRRALSLAAAKHFLYAADRAFGNLAALGSVRKTLAEASRTGGSVSRGAVSAI